jgi:hypothetical protein
VSLDFSSTGEKRCLLAFSEDGKWRLRSARMLIDCGFLDSVEVDGQRMALAMGPFGANATLYVAQNVRTDTLGQIADLSLIRWSDGLIVESNESFLSAVAVEGPTGTDRPAT